MIMMNDYDNDDDQWSVSGSIALKVNITASVCDRHGIKLQTSKHAKLM